MPRREVRTHFGTPYWQCGERVRLYQGDVLSQLAKVPDKSIQCVVTSPPYWGLRSYLPRGHPLKGLELGGEKTPQEYVEKMARIFREVRRVLRDDGTCWLNLGDTYTGGGGFWPDAPSNKAGAKQTQGRGGDVKGNGYKGLPSGNLVGVPWRVALALQADGWVLRQDVVWAKKSAMPESVQNRCTKSHEYIFLLSKGMGYYYDAEAIKEPLTESSVARYKYAHHDIRTGVVGHLRENGEYHPGARHGAPHRMVPLPAGRNKRSVWTHDDEQALLAWMGQNHPDLLEEYLTGLGNKESVWWPRGRGYKGQHFATFPPKLIEPCILAGTSEYGSCTVCGAPFKRVVEKEKLKRDRPNDYVKRSGEPGTGNACANTVAGVKTVTTGWRPTCKHLPCLSKKGQRPCLVLDPFAGSGTTLLVALEHGRYAVGIDLHQEYLDDHIIPRLAELGIQN